jgi:hypothetical protein
MQIDSETDSSNQIILMLPPFGRAEAAVKAIVY